MIISYEMFSRDNLYMAIQASGKRVCNIADETGINRETLLRHIANRGCMSADKLKRVWQVLEKYVE